MAFQIICLWILMWLLSPRLCPFYCCILPRYTIQDLLFSSSAKDLIRGLLRTDPQNRFTVEQVINNPWIKVNTLDFIVHQYFKAIFPSNRQYTVRSVFVPAQKHFCICRDNLLTRVEDLTKQTGITRLSVRMAHVALGISLREKVIVRSWRQTVRFVRTLSER